MFERFTDRSRRAVVLAQESVRMRNAAMITTDDLLRGLIGEGEGLAAKALANIGITVELPTEDGSSPSGHIPFTDDAKQALESSLREALQLGHNYIATEHILLALCRADACPSSAEVRKEVIRLLSGAMAPKADSAPLVAIAADTGPLVVVPHRPHSRAAVKWVIYDPTLPPDLTQLASCDDEHAAQAIARTLAANLTEFRQCLTALDAAEPF